MTKYLKLMRFDKPVGTLLLLWPTWIALWLAADGTPPVNIFIVFTLGVVFMRAAGCVVNDYTDRHLDGKVARTKSRPLVTNAIPPRSALVVFIILCCVSLALVLTLNKFTIYLSLLAIILAVVYPFSKRFTYFPQVFLGLAFGFGIIMAYGAIQNKINFEAVFLYLGVICWIVAYDTLYALIDIKDDLKIGIKSSAIAFGEYNNIIIFILQLAFLFILSLIGIYKNLNWVYYLGIVIALVLFLQQAKNAKDLDRDKCFKAFLHNNRVGLVLFICLFGSYYL